MTQRTRRAIMDYWIAKHAFYWRRYSRFFVLALSVCMTFSEVSFAAETKSEVKPVSLLSLVSKESKPAEPAAKDSALKQTVTKPTAQKSSPAASLFSKLVKKETVPMSPAAQAEAAAAKKEKDKKTALFDPSDEDEKAPGKVENVTGEVGSHNNYGVAVELPADLTTGQAQEAWFNFTSKTKLSGIRSFKELQDGDTVTVMFKQTETGKRILKAITMVAKAPKEIPQAVSAVEGSVL